MTVQHDKPIIGALWKIAAFLCYAALNTLARFLSGGAAIETGHALPVNVIIFFQDLFALIVVSPWIIKQIRVHQLPQYIPTHLLRVCFSALAVIAWYFALYYLPQADAVALSILGPLIGVVGAKIWLKEHIGKVKMLTIGLTFLFAFLLLQPLQVLSQQQNNLVGILCVVLSSLLFAMAKITTRKLASLGESRQLLTAYLLLIIVPLTFIPALFVWVTPNLEQLLWLIMAGVLTAGALYAVSSALAYAEVSFLAPFDFVRFILNASIAYFAFMELPAPWTFALVIAVLFVSLIGTKIKLR